MSIQPFGIRDPAQSAAGDSGDAKCDVVAVAKLLFAVVQELHEGAIDVPEAEEAEVVGVNSGSPRPDVRGAATEGETPSGQPAGRRRYVAC